MANEDLVVARFFIHTVQNDAESKKKGRPIYDEYEAVEIRFSANKFTKHVAPAHEVFKRERNFQTGEVTELTYAMAYNEQYKKFKEGHDQTQAGTPLSELPFLTQSKRLELKALNIHTAEALATVDGPPLKQLGMGGRELKNQAQAYLDKAAGSVDVVKMAATITALQEQLAKLQDNAAGAPDEPPASVSPFMDMDADDIKNWIENATGERPKGNPSHATLVKRADEVNAELAKKAQQAAA
jgi:hypothetical protein